MPGISCHFTIIVWYNLLMFAQKTAPQCLSYTWLPRHPLAHTALSFSWEVGSASVMSTQNKVNVALTNNYRGRLRAKTFTDARFWVKTLA